MKLFLLLCFFFGASFAQIGNFCYDAADRVDDGCATCTCEPNPDIPTTRKWVCTQTCDVCPAEVVSEVCIVNRCDVGAYCTAYPDAECVIPDCNSCDFVWRKNGQDVDCQNTGEGDNCPEGEDKVECLINPCRTSLCPNHPDARCYPNYCGGCHAVFKNSSGDAVNCSSRPTDNTCRPGTELVDCLTNPCLFASCPGNREARCYPSYCGRCHAVFKNSSGDVVSCRGPDRDDLCPADKPFMNCTYADVCQSQSCSAQPSARCTVDHCGGCNPVFLNQLGMRLNCTTGQATGCPPGLRKTTCYSNPCDNEECEAVPMARCVVLNCGRCHAAFVNDQSEYINCDTGEASACPPNMVANPASREEACANATCPRYPNAMCVAKPCLSPKKPLECPYEFIGQRGLPVICKTEYQWPSTLTGTKPGTCPALTRDDDDECQDECDNDIGCPRHLKCCHNGCARICTPPKEMVDHCPVVPMRAGGNNCRQECSSDMDCIGGIPGSGTKCCTHGCGTRCKIPITAEKPGTCPMPMISVTPSSTCSTNCTSDDDCPGRKKCCHHGFGSPCSCHDPQEQPGGCPSPTNYLLSAATNRPCSTDADCNAGQRRTKCCAYNCGKVCREPVKVDKPGMCPWDVTGSRGCAKVCSGDQDCPDAMKCCGNGCACSAPVTVERPGMCPKAAMNTTGTCAQMCSEDQDCPANRKCCSNGCGHACTIPIVIKTGMCPVPSNSTGGICVEMCSGDQDCPGNRKCCSNGCGHTCAKPVNIPASCPIVPDGEAGTCGNQCQLGAPGRSGCPPGQKCCFNGCGLSCLRPMPLGCGEDEESEECDFDACEDASCTAMPNATCVTSECGRCRPKFFVDDEEVRCPGQKTCSIDGDDRVYVTGEQRQKPDGCNSCVCTGRGWTCTKRDCSNLKLFNVVMRLNGNFDTVENRTDRFIGKIKNVFSNRIPGLAPSAMRNIKFRPGSIVVEFMVAGDGTTDLENTIQKLKSEVTGGNFSFEFEGEQMLADPGSFNSEDVTPDVPVTPTSKAGKLTAVYMVIGILAMLAIVNPA